MDGTAVMLSGRHFFVQSLNLLRSGFVFFLLRSSLSLEDSILKKEAILGDEKDAVFQKYISDHSQPKAKCK